MSPVVVVGTAALVAVAAGLLATSARTLADRDSRATGAPVLASLGALGGAGAASWARDPVELATFAVLALGCVLLVVVDLASHRLPDVVTAPTAVALLLGLAIAAGLAADWGALLRAVLAGLALGTAFLLLALASPRAIGLGDVKLAALLGVFLGWFGWATVLTGVVATFVLGGLAALTLMAAGRATRSTALAFGPWLVLGAGVAAVLARSALTS